MNKKKVRVISLLLSFIIIISFINLKNTSVKADQVATATEPKFTITNLKATPNPAKVGEDILVSGQINPQDFETTVQPKEIVLVLDTSGSMNETVILDKECTEVRVKYCTTHKLPEGSDNNKKGHSFISDYCVKHDKVGKHNDISTKIDELKKAAESFVETMKDVSNLKIGIVAYSTEATINPYNYNIGKREVRSLDSNTSFEVQNYKSYNLKLLDRSDNTLNQIINNIKPLGGTNTGEGIRKAIYMLDNGEKNANKTIVLMSDGKPTYYSTYSNKTFYKEINNNYPSVSGTGTSTNKETREYSNSIAKMVKEKGYNSYSVGYGITDGKDDFMKIHASMRGLSLSSESTKENGFFFKSEGSITEIFNQIAENIKNSYELKEVSLDIALNQSFNLDIGGNEVKVGNIIYEKVSEYKNTGKVRYHAEPVNFSFIVNASQVGQEQIILSNIDIKFLFENKSLIVSCKIDVKVDVKINDLPNITAELISENKLEIKNDGEITLKYKINPEDFPYNNASNSGDIDVVVIVELGKKQGNLEPLKNGIKNKLTDAFQSEKKAKFSFITFNKDEAKKVTTLKSFESSTNYYHDIRLAVDSFTEGTVSESSEKDISNALNNAYEELERNSRPTATKNIVIISNNDINYNKEVTNNIKVKGYNIVTLSLETENSNKNLYKLHSDLGGKADSIFNINNDYNNINNSKMDLVKEKIVSYATAKPYEFKPVINLNLGSNFEPVSGIVRSMESGKRDIGLVEVPTIIYNLTQNNNYHAEYKDNIITVKLRANNLKSGTYSFGSKSDNIMKYNNILGNTVLVNLTTPIITVKPQVKDLIHGLYNGIKDNDLAIDTSLANLGFEVAEGATVTYGASFILTGNEVNLTLNLDNKFAKINDYEIMGYVVDSGKLIGQGVTVKNTERSNEYKLSIIDSKDSSAERRIVLIYKRKVAEVQGEGSIDFTNKIVIEDLSESVSVKIYKTDINEPRLPDLF